MGHWPSLFLSMSQDLFALGIPIGEKLLRTAAVYAFLLIGLRLAGKRELGQLNPFDLVVLLLLSNTIQNAIIGNDNSLAGGIIGATSLLAINWIVVRYLYAHPVVARYLEGDADMCRRGSRRWHATRVNEASVAQSAVRTPSHPTM